MEVKTKEPKRTHSYVNAVFAQIQKQPDIEDILILNKSSNPIKTTMESSEAIEYAGYYGTLTEKAKQGVQIIDPEDELKMLRVRTKHNEVLITPDEKITVLVVQNAKDKIWKP